MKRIKWLKYVFYFFLPIFLLGLSPPFLPIGGVRTVYVDDEKVEVINLKMGQATVLSFLEKPVKVNVGNKNYFNIEYIHNDVNIQPLQILTQTNLFVYGKYHRYGFVLRVNGSDRYDDLVKVRWSDSENTLLEKNKETKEQAKVVSTQALQVALVPSPPPLPLPVQQPLPTPKVEVVLPLLEIKCIKITIDPIRKFHLVDLEITKLQNEVINLKELKMNIVTDSTQAVTPPKIIEVVFKKDQLNDVGEKTKGRIIMKKITKSDFKIEASYFSDKQMFKQILTVKEKKEE
ncbi:MAG: TrbG/VirB9 family P-type conjugative transfer protein [Oligoflexia bacterium]|nr:TrbG/VirB9 family P-type conjugative transfer protein [Oligoflexia bacterium]